MNLALTEQIHIVESGTQMSVMYTNRFRFESMDYQQRQEHIICEIVVEEESTEIRHLMPEKS